MSTIITIIIITFIPTFGDEKTENPNLFRKELDAKLGLNLRVPCAQLQALC